MSDAEQHLHAIRVRLDQERDFFERAVEKHGDDPLWLMRLERLSVEEALSLLRREVGRELPLLRREADDLVFAAAHAHAERRTKRADEEDEDSFVSPYVSRSRWR